MKYDLTEELPFTLTVQGRDSIIVVATIGYSKADPYGICLAFHTGLDKPVEWTFARELFASVAENTKKCAGEGDVRVWLSQSWDTLNLGLMSPAGKAHFEVRSGYIKSFLKRTYQLVPPGEETGHLDLSNDTIAAFLQGKAAS